MERESPARQGGTPKELAQIENKNAEKTCFFCGNAHHAKKLRFWAKGYQLKFWVCVFCYNERNKLAKEGKEPPIQQILDAQPLDSQARVARFNNPWQQKKEGD